MFLCVPKVTGVNEGGDLLGAFNGKMGRHCRSSSLEGLTVLERKGTHEVEQSWLPNANMTLINLESSVLMTSTN